MATTRETMLSKPFSPGDDGTSADWRQIVALEYIAVYLGEICTKLDSLNGENGNGLTSELRNLVLATRQVASSNRR